jgi:hypothetical protein
VRRALVGLALAACLAACSVERVTEPDPGAIPSGPPQAMGGDPPIGPVIEVGRGLSGEIGWRYSVYRTAGGVCTQLETAAVAATGCGIQQPVFETAIAGAGKNELPSGATIVEGMVSPDAAEIWLQLDDGRRISGTLMALDPAGLEAQAFVVIAEPGGSLHSVVALDEGGSELDAYDLRGQP